MISIPIEQHQKPTREEEHEEFSGLIEGGSKIIGAGILLAIVMAGGIVALIIYVTVKGGKAAARNPDKALDIAERTAKIVKK
ncbi:hypothetical protein BKI52_33115 [marine bacterium AO1-C]|nr:hypothetical protein BKI52_33115 [marine bacterium AO1-C]